MPTLNRELQRPASYYESLKDRINAGRAVALLNSVLDGAEIPAQQERVSMFYINKVVPNLQAVAVEHNVGPIESVHDLQALAALAGIDLRMIWTALKNQAPIEHNSLENHALTNNSQEAPLPPDADA